MRAEAPLTDSESASGLGSAARKAHRFAWYWHTICGRAAGGGCVLISQALSADLARLTEALEGPEVDLEHVLTTLCQNAQRAVACFLGLSLTLTVHDHDYTLTRWWHDSAEATSSAVTSLRLPLSVLLAGHVGQVVFFGSKLGGLVDLAADAEFALGLTDGEFWLDRDLTAFTRNEGLIGLQESSTINQAVGFLIGCGRQPVAARTELRELAESAQLSLYQVAGRILSNRSHRGAGHR